MQSERKWKWSRSVMSNSLRPRGLWPSRLLRPWDSPGKNTGVGCHALLQGMFPTQGSNPGLLNCRRFFTNWATREAQLHVRWDHMNLLTFRSSWIQNGNFICFELIICIMWNVELDKAQAGIQIPGEISITSDMHMTPPLWQKAKRNWRTS